MSERLYVLLADTAVAERVVDALRAEDVADEALHAVARHDPEHDLPEAGLWEATDVGPATGRGAVAGGVTGAVAGLAALAFPPLGIVIGGGAVAAGGLAGAGLGAWVASMIGVSESADEVAAYDAAIADGAVLLMVDCEPARCDTVRGAIQQQAPTADVRQTPAGQR